MEENKENNSEDQNPETTDPAPQQQKPPQQPQADSQQTPPYQSAPQYGAYAQPQYGAYAPPTQGAPSPNAPQSGARTISLKIWQFVLTIVAAIVAGMVLLIAIAFAVPQERTYTQAEMDDVQTKLDKATKRADKAEKQYKALKEINQLLDENGSSSSSGTENQAGGSATDSQNRNKKVGETESNSTLAMTFKAVSEPKSVGQQWNGTQPDLTPASGTKFLSVQVSVKNNGKEPIDLTCGYPLEIKAMNDKDQLYTPIDDLYKIPGNPECNAMLQPGMSSEVNYVFNVPSDSKMIGFAWRDRTDITLDNQYASFVFKDSYSIQ